MAGYLSVLIVMEDENPSTGSDRLTKTLLRRAPVSPTTGPLPQAAESEPVKGHLCQTLLPLLRLCPPLSHSPGEAEGASPVSPVPHEKLLVWRRADREMV